VARLIHPITFIGKLIKKNERREAFTLMIHQRAIVRLAFHFDQRSAAMGYDSFPCVRKSGRTTNNAALILTWALRREASKPDPHSCQ
jgi:hypothetical protein